MIHVQHAAQHRRPTLLNTAPSNAERRQLQYWRRSVHAPNGIVDVNTTASLNEPTSTIVVLMARPTITELDH